MDRAAVHHLKELAGELLEHGFDRVVIEREVRRLEVGDEDLDGREVDCVTITAGDNQIVAIEAALVDDGAGYAAALSQALRDGPLPSGFLAL